MPDSQLVKAIRRLVKQTVEAEKPVVRVFGVITKLEPFTVQVNEKLVLDEDFLVITQTVRNYINWKFIEVGDKVVMTRQAGGQLFIVDDMLSCDKDFDEMVILKHTHEYKDETEGSTDNKTTEEAKRVE